MRQEIVMLAPIVHALAGDAPLSSAEGPTFPELSASNDGGSPLIKASADKPSLDGRALSG
jgi:hypothetical protein